MRRIYNNRSEKAKYFFFFFCKNTGQFFALFDAGMASSFDLTDIAGNQKPQVTGQGYIIYCTGRLYVVSSL